MNRIKSLVATVTAFILAVLFGPPTFRLRTCDVAFTYRMGAGFPGDINRTHPFSVLPGLANATTPPRNYGDPVLVDTATNSYKGVVSGDQSPTPLAFQGVIVRPYPMQQSSGGMSAAIGTAAAPTSGVIDICEEGYIMVKIPPGVTVTKNGTVYVWCAANSGNHVQGACEGAASAGNTVPVINAKFNGPADASGNVEIRVMAL